MAKLSVKNWSEFQHYTKRNPPWIKLHKKMLDDRQFQCLPDASRALAPMLWLLASETKDGNLDYSLPDFAFRLHRTEKEVSTALKPLIDNGFFFVLQDASTSRAERKQVASESLSETETETETEKRQKPVEIPFELPKCINQELWEAYREMRKKKRAPMTDRARNLIIRKLCKWSEQGYDINAILETSITRNWTDVFEPKTSPISAEPPKPRQWAPVTEMAPRGAQ
jgi:hypothetical protein